MFNIDRSWIENQILKKIKRYFQRGMGGGEGKKEKNLRAKSKKKKKKNPKKEISTWVNLNEQTHEKLTNTYYRLFSIYYVII